MVAILRRIDDKEFLTLLLFSGMATILVYTSFTLMVLQALWWNFTNVLDPVKVAIFAGYFVLVSHLLVMVRRRNVLLIFDLALLLASLYALWSQVQGFVGRGVYIGLGEPILPIELRVVISIALILPLAFVVLAGLATATANRMMIAIRRIGKEGGEGVST